MRGRFGKRGGIRVQLGRFSYSHLPFYFFCVDLLCSLSTSLFFSISLMSLFASSSARNLYVRCGVRGGL